MSIQDVKVPDIGDFKDVPVIEIMVKPGDVVKAEDPLVSLESDKATMDVPSPLAGKVVELLIAVGDKVSEGTPILRMESAAAITTAASAPAAAASAPAPAPAAATSAAPASAASL
ncbi:MAG: dihydrolipoyl dehydrogenase, partial [Rubrivivax sp.]|nr:dihydrolipoyl dehydrogenase [Rubrivivax sp.]